MNDRNQIHLFDTNDWDSSIDRRFVGKPVPLHADISRTPAEQKHESYGRLRDAVPPLVEQHWRAEGGK